MGLCEEGSVERRRSVRDFSVKRGMCVCEEGNVCV